MKKITAAAALLFCLAVGIASIHAGSPPLDNEPGSPDAEFQLARMKYRTFGGGGSRPGVWNPWWAIDYPYAEEHFFPALRRSTNIQVSDEEVHVDVTDDRIFNHPFLLMPQPGRGQWSPNPIEAARLREYCMRGGFLLVDDLHSEYDWAVFASSMRRVFPDRPIVDIPDEDALMHVFFDLDERTAMPGKRHLGMSRGQIEAYMEGPPRWRGIYDDHGRLMVAINFNSDMGDAWEHADDPYYPVPMTALAYKLGINYIIYSMTH
jgi:hypothetical protein